MLIKIITRYVQTQFDRILSFKKYKYFIIYTILNFLFFRKVNHNIARLISQNKQSFFKTLNSINKDNKIQNYNFVYVTGLPRTGGHYFTTVLRKHFKWNNNKHINHADPFIDNESNIRFEQIKKNIKYDFIHLRNHINNNYPEQKLFIFKNSGLGYNLNFIKNFDTKKIIKVFLLIRNPFEIYQSWKITMAGFEWLINNKNISSRYLDIRDYDKSNQINIFIKSYVDYYSNALQFIKSNKHKNIGANIEVSWFENHNINLKKFIKKKLKLPQIRNRSQNYYEFSKLISNKNLILLKNLEKKYKYFDKKIKLI